MKRIAAQAAKEWSELRRDRLSLALAFILPVATLLLFSFGVRLQARNIPLIVEDQDHSSLSRSFSSRLLATNVFTQGSRAGKNSPEEAIRRSETRGAIVIPQGFACNLDMGRQATITAYVDGSDINSAQVVNGALSGTIAYFINSIAGPDPRMHYVLPRIRVWFNPGLKESLFVAPGVFGIILWMYPALLAAAAVSKEFEQGTIVQSYASSLTALELLLGKALVYFLVGAAQAMVSMVIACFCFGLRLKTDPSLLVVATAIYIAAAVFFGLTAGVYTKHQTVAVQAVATGGFFPALLLSGFVYPIDNIPMPLSLVCMVVPARYYIEVCRDAFVRGFGWWQMWYQPLVLLGFAMFLITCAWLGMRRMQVIES